MNLRVSKICCILLTVILGNVAIELYAQEAPTTVAESAPVTENASAGDAVPVLPSEQDQYNHLSFTNKTLTREDLEQIIKVKGMLSVDFTGTILTDDVVKYIAKLPNLREIDLTESKGLTDAGFAGLANAEKLEGLAAINLSDVTSQTVINVLSKLPGLFTLSLGNQLVTPDVIQEILKLKSLKEIALFYNDVLTDDGILELAKGEYTSVGLIGLDKISDTGLQTFAKMTSLEAFFMTYCPNVTDKGLYFLSDLTNMKVINIGACEKIDGRGFVYLKKLEKLEEIYISQNSQLLDDCFYYFSQCPSLKVITIDASEQVTDKGLLYLKDMSQLKTLIISACPKVTQAGIDELKKSLPNTEIVLEVDPPQEEKKSDSVAPATNPQM